MAKAADARTKVSERAELLEKASVELAEAARDQATQRAEIAERDAVEEEAQVERRVLETVGAIEKGELEGENQALRTLKDILSNIASVLGPIVIPGVFLAIYAVIASFVAEKPEPSMGGEAEEVRKRMGRASRAKTAIASTDPWAKEGEMLLKAKKLFSELDANKDGELEVSELEALFVAKHGDKLAKQLMAQLDVNNDGSVDEDEFIRGYKEVLMTTEAGNVGS